MTERYTMIDVRNRATSLALFAKECGFETKDWGVSRGTQHYNFSYRPSGQATLTTIDIGPTAREACARLEAIKRGMQEMQSHLDTPRQVKLLSAALRASAKLEEHRHSCGHCALHLVGARATWCDAYRRLLEIWSEGIVLAHADHKQKYPLGAALAQAISA